MTISKITYAIVIVFLATSMLLAVFTVVPTGEDDIIQWRNNLTADQIEMLKITFVTFPEKTEQSMHWLTYIFAILLLIELIILFVVSSTKIKRIKTIETQCENCGCVFKVKMHKNESINIACPGCGTEGIIE